MPCAGPDRVGAWICADVDKVASVGTVPTTPEHERQPDSLPPAAQTQPPPLETSAVEEALARIPGLGRAVVVARTASTSTDLVKEATADPAAWPDRSVLVADHQAAGRGRAGRTWTTPPRAALTVSVLLRPAVPVGRFGWVPLLAGLAVVQALRDVAGVTAVLKWPNDVLVEMREAGDLPGWGRYRKVAGVLGELVTSPGAAVVVGIGVNVSQRAAELPVPSATSLALVAAAGGEHTVQDGTVPDGRVSDGTVPDGTVPDRTALLAAIVGRLVTLDGRWRAAGGDAVASGLAQECSLACATIGSVVQVELPGGGVLEGTAQSLSPDGALEVLDSAGRIRTVLAGDVHHLRTGPPAY